jgi:hypothetical protein
MIELHRKDHNSFDDGGEVFINIEEIAFIGRHYRAGTNISDGTAIYFRNPVAPLSVREDYDRVKNLWITNRGV